MAKNIVIIGGGASAKHAAESILKKAKDAVITIVQANRFVEWPLAMTMCLVKPELHDKAISPNSNKFEVKGVRYKYAVAASVDTGSKQIKLAESADVAPEETLPYDVIVVATGFGRHLCIPRLV